MKRYDQLTIVYKAKADASPDKLSLVVNGNASCGLRQKHIREVSETGVPVCLLQRLTPAFELRLESYHVSVFRPSDNVCPSAMVEELNGDVKRTPRSSGRAEVT